MSGTLQDLRRAARSLSHNPGFTGLAVVTLALGIGASTLVFSLLHSLLVRPYPFADLDRLVTIWEAPATGSAEPEVHRRPLTPGDSLDLAAEVASLQSHGAFRHRDFRLTGAREATLVRGVVTGPGFFETLGVAPSMGTRFLAADYEVGRGRAAILSHGFWIRALGADPNVVSREIRLDGERYTIRGIMPPDFHYPLGPVDLWTPLVLAGAEANERAAASVVVIGRLPKGVALSTVRDQVDGVARALERRYPRTNLGRRFAVLALRQEQTALMGPFVIVFGAAAAFVLLVACANVASLLLARATASQREVAIRLALGAARWRIGRQLAAESLLISAGALAVALWLVGAGLDAIRGSLPGGIAVWLAGWRSIGLEGRAFAFAAAVAVATTMIFGLLPLSRAWRPELPDGLGRRVQGSAAFGKRAGLSGNLVAAQVGLALILLAGAAATVKGFVRVTDLYRGFDPAHVLTMHLALTEPMASDPVGSVAFFERAATELSELPGVRAAAFVSQLPADLGPIPTRRLRLEGRPVSSPGEEPVVDLQTITPAYFRAFGIPWIRGRAFLDADARDSAPVAIVSETASRRLFPGADPLGRRISFSPPGQPEVWRRIVGIAGDAQQYWLDRGPRPTLYVPLPQSPRDDLFLVIRTEGEPSAIMPAVRRRIAEIDPSQTIEEIRTLSAVVDESTAIVRIAAGVLVSAGLVALALGAVGIFGLVAYTVARSKREIGIRMALGARTSDVLRPLLGGALRRSILGAVIGLAGGAVLTRLLSSILFGLAPGDGLTLAAAALFLLATALAACYIPARRATRVDPVVALRSE